MLTLKTKIRPMPKYIEKRIKKMDKQRKPEQNGVLRFYSYLAIWDKELVKVTVAVKNRYKTWCCKQVIVHGVHSDLCLLKDIVYYRMSGYSVGWWDEGHTTYPKWYEGGWGDQDDRYFNPYAPIVNPEVVKKIKEYKYSAYELFDGVDILPYLRLYEEYPEVEYITKLGLTHYVLKKQLLKKAHKDKGFRTWLGRNREQLTQHFYDIPVIIRAYSKNIPLDKAQCLENARKELKRQGSYGQLSLFFKDDLARFDKYMKEQKISSNSYLDYLNACRHLGIDMSDTKNRYPRDFRRWHNIRIDEYASQKVELEEKKKRQAIEKFSKVANKYLNLQQDTGDVFVCIIAKSPDELVKEGASLHHCVGRMGYDQKFTREETLIFFVRKADEIEKPLVTLEYSLSMKKVLQCYGDHDSKPTDDVLKYVNETWLPYANKNLNRLQTAA